jgi:hypothetical protein
MPNKNNAFTAVIIPSKSAIKNNMFGKIHIIIKEKTTNKERMEYFSRSFPLVIKRIMLQSISSEIKTRNILSLVLILCAPFLFFSSFTK